MRNRSAFVSRYSRRLALLLAAVFALWLPSSAAAFEFLTKWGTSGNGDGQFFEPHGIDVDSAGHVYVADSDNHRVQKFGPNGDFITKWGNLGTADGQFGDEPHDLAVAPDGSLYVIDSQNNRVQHFSASGTFIGKWGSAGAGDGQFGFPTGIAVNGAGNVYVADFQNHRVQVFSATGDFIRKWGSLGAGDGQFAFPRGIAVDGAGNVYVSDSANNRIQKFSSSGALITKWGTLGAGNGELDKPIGIAFDPAGNVYVADSENNRIQKFTSSGGFLSVLGGLGTGDGQFDFPAGIATDCRGNLYVADTDNERIQKFGEPGLADPPCLPEPPEPPAAQCSDGIDNDSDGDVDANDLGCFTGGAFDPDDSNEGDDPIACDTRKLTISDLARTGRRRDRARVSGRVDPELIGANIQIVALSDIKGALPKRGKVIGEARAKPNRSFAAKVKLPFRDDDAIKALRLLARSKRSGDESRAEILTRRARLIEVSSTGGKTTVRGLVNAPKPEDLPLVRIQRRVACVGAKQWEIVAITKLRPDMGFRTTFADPDGIAGSIFRAVTRFAEKKGRPATDKTATPHVALTLG